MPMGDGKYLASNGGRIELRDLNYNVVPLIKPDDEMGFYSPRPVLATKAPPLIVRTPMNRDVDKDGKASFQVPSEVPICFLGLDRERRMLRKTPRPT